MATKNRRNEMVEQPIKVVKKAKVIKINANEAIADSNTIQLPCVAEYKGERVTFLEYTWEQKVNGTPIKRGISVSGHGKYGIPTLREFDVLLALQRIFISKKTRDGIVELKTEDITEDDLFIDFTINELAKELGYSTPNSSTRENLKRSIMILVATSVTNMYEGGIYDVRTKSYIKDPHAMFHYLESVEGYEVKEENETVTDVTKIKISKFFYDMIVSNYKLFYNTDILKKTKNVMARKIYLLALQWKGNNDYTVINMDTLIQRVPMMQTEKKYQKQYIKRALDILNNNNIVKVVYDQDNTDRVWFWFKEPKEKEVEAKYFTDHYKTYREIEEALSSEFGLLKIEIPMYLDVQRIRYIQALLRYTKTRMCYGGISDPREFIISYLKGNFPIDPQYYDKEDDEVAADGQ